MSKRTRLVSLALAIIAVVVAVTAWMGVQRERERRQFEALVTAGRSAVSARPPGTAQCAAVVDKLKPRLEEDAAAASDAAWRVLGDCAMLTRRWPEAVTAYREIATRQPQQSRAHGDLSRALTRAGQHLEAVRAAQLSVQLAPDAWQAQRVLGLAAAGAGDLPTAIAAIERAMTLVPDAEKPAAARLLAELQARRDQPAQAPAATAGQATPAPDSAENSR